MAVFSSCNTHLGNLTPNAGMTENVVRAGRLFHPPWIDLRQHPRTLNSFLDIPFLISIHHQLVMRTNLTPDQPCASQIVLRFATDFQLEMRPSLCQRLVCQAQDFFIAETKPSYGSCVRRISCLLQLCETSIHAAFALTQNIHGLFSCQRVGDVAEVDCADNIFGVHISKQLPKWLAFYACIQIPYCVNQCTRRQVNHAFFWTEPAELAVGSQLPVKGSKVIRDRRQIAPYS